MFHDASVKALEKKVSILEKEKAKAEADRDELKKQLEELMKVNEELKSFMFKQAKKIKKMEGDVDDKAKLFELLSTEISDLHGKNVKLNDINKTLNQLISELHEASVNEFKTMKLEMEAMKADKAMKDEQLSMLYTVMEHHLGIDVHSICNNIEIQRLKKEGFKGKESWLGKLLREEKGFVLVGEATIPSYSFDEIIRRVQIVQKKNKAKEHKVLLLRWKEEEEEVDEELEDVLDAVDNYDPSWDDFNEKKDDDDEDQGSSGLLIVNPSVQ
ncbi:hypothetical protein Hanom_Chr03g00179831 [Helianthus anomalus]